MKLHYAQKLSFIVLVGFLLSFFPFQAVQAETITTTETWTTNRSLTEDLVIASGGHLTIEAGVVVTASCSDGYNLGYDGERVEIFIESGGRLTVNGATFQGDGSAGCWGGIIIWSEDSLTDIQDSTIRDVDQGIHIIDSSPTIEGNEITNIRGDDGSNSGAAGELAVGIQISSRSLSARPVIMTNHIHGITGGSGIAGADGADGGSPGDSGADGGAGGTGGHARGIFAGAGTNPFIQGNTIEYIYGGACGNGGDGGAGAAGVAGTPETDGGNGGAGGNGGQGGRPGDVIGIYSQDTLDTLIQNNEIAFLSQPEVCNGGNGGQGAAGGQGGDNLTDSNSATNAGNGGDGGNGGATGWASNGAIGIYVERTSIYEGLNDLISENTMHDYFGSIGGTPGAGGHGGDGGSGGNMVMITSTGECDGGDGGNGGVGGTGGTHYGGHPSVGFRSIGSGLTIESNTISTLVGGDGLNGGAGGTGGAGGQGGTGGYDMVYHLYGAGGDGGAGGAGGQAGQGGVAGFTQGVTIVGEASQASAIFNNDIWRLTGGQAGSGGTPGIGGAGGNGGDTVNMDFGVGGAGGDGGQGGDGIAGGDGGYSYLIELSTQSADIYNNTLADVVAAEGVGTASSGMAGGVGGLGGEGPFTGPDGSDGASGGVVGFSVSGRAYGIYQYKASGLTSVYNNILYLSDGLPENTYALYESSTVFETLDYNVIYGWYSTYTTTENGPHSILADPLFVSAMDHNLKYQSPCLDSGTDTGAPSDDINGNSRPFDGNGDDVAIVDIGAFERQLSPIFLYIPVFQK